MFGYLYGQNAVLNDLYRSLEARHEELLRTAGGRRGADGVGRPASGAPAVADPVTRGGVRMPGGPGTAQEPGSSERAASDALAAPSARDASGGEQVLDTSGDSRASAASDLPACVLRELTNAERLVAGLVAAGLTNGQVARRLDRSPHTINYHLRQIFRKANVRSRTELASLYYRSVVRDGDAAWAEAPST